MRFQLVGHILDRANSAHGPAVFVANHLGDGLDVAGAGPGNSQAEPQTDALAATQYFSAALLDRVAVIRMDEFRKFGPRPRTFGRRQTEDVARLLRPGDAIAFEIVFPVPEACQACGRGQLSLERSRSLSC